MVNKMNLEVPLYAEPCGVKEDYYILFLNRKYNFQSKIIMPSIVSLGNSLKKDDRLRLYYVNKRSKKILHRDSNRPLSSLTPLDLLTKKLPRRKPSTNSQSKKTVKKTGSNLQEKALNEVIEEDNSIRSNEAAVQESMTSNSQKETRMRKNSEIESDDSQQEETLHHTIPISNMNYQESNETSILPKSFVPENNTNATEFIHIQGRHFFTFVSYVHSQGYIKIHVLDSAATEVNGNHNNVAPVLIWIYNMNGYTYNKIIEIMKTPKQRMGSNNCGIHAAINCTLASKILASRNQVNHEDISTEDFQNFLDEKNC